MPDNKIGVKVPEIMLPDGHIDLSKWAVVACDQYTSQRSYWAKIEEEVEGIPSTLHIIFPEVYLEDADKNQRISAITKTMQNYLNEGLLKPLSPGFIYVERTLQSGIRKGLIVALDLEEYDYHEGSQTLIRATEGTVLDRLPPRISIRQGAVLETPHIMVLIDDPDKTVIEPTSEHLSKMQKLYDFDLMMDGGHIIGYQVDDQFNIGRIIKALTRLADPVLFRKKYGVGEEKGVLLFAMGDGNHSLATAKACWEEIKKNLSQNEIESHPARYALVELVNVHDESLIFEPIHRVLFRVEPEKVLEEMSAYYQASNQGFECELYDSESAMMKQFNEKRESTRGHLIRFVLQNKWGILTIPDPKSNLEVGTLQAFLDDYLKKTPDAYVDYIHGDEVTTELGGQEGNMGFLLPTMSKHDLFKTVILDGALPRKTFSMGEAHEKRFYLECRKITK